MYEPTLVDCDLPLDLTTEHDEGGPKLAFDVSTFKRTHEITTRVVVLTSVIEPPQYQEVVALDAAIRANWPLPSEINLYLDAKLGPLKRAIICGPFRALRTLLVLHFDLCGF
jgi:hypothetical protein